MSNCSGRNLRRTFNRHPPAASYALYLRKNAHRAGLRKCRLFVRVFCKKCRIIRTVQKEYGYRFKPHRQPPCCISPAGAADVVRRPAFGTGFLRKSAPCGKRGFRSRHGGAPSCMRSAAPRNFRAFVFLRLVIYFPISKYTFIKT